MCHVLHMHDIQRAILEATRKQKEDEDLRRAQEVGTWLVLGSLEPLPLSAQESLRSVPEADDFDPLTELALKESEEFERECS